MNSSIESWGDLKTKRIYYKLNKDSFYITNIEMTAEIENFIDMVIKWDNFSFDKSGRIESTDPLKFYAIMLEIGKKRKDPDLFLRALLKVTNEEAREELKKELKKML